MGTMFSSVLSGSVHEPAGVALATSSSLASFVFSLHEAILCFPDETRFIWPKPWRSSTKWIYLFNRYIPLFFQLAIILGGVYASELQPHCHVWFILQGAFLQATIAAADLILMLRVYALYVHWRFIKLFLVSLWVSENALMLGTLIYALSDVKFNAANCVITRLPPEFGWFAAWATLAEVALLAMTLRKFAQSLREGWDSAPIMVLLVRDGTWAFMIIFLTFAGCSATYTLMKGPQAGVMFNWLYSIPSVTACRLVLNMHASRAEPWPPMSTIAPARPGRRRRPRLSLRGASIDELPSTMDKDELELSIRAMTGRSARETADALSSIGAMAGHDAALFSLPSLPLWPATTGHGRTGSPRRAVGEARSINTATSSANAAASHGTSVAGSNAASAGHAYASFEIHSFGTAMSGANATAGHGTSVSGSKAATGDHTHRGSPRSASFEVRSFGTAISSVNATASHDTSNAGSRSATAGHRHSTSTDLDWAHASFPRRPVNRRLRSWDGLEEDEVEMDTRS